MDNSNDDFEESTKEKISTSNNYDSKYRYNNNNNINNSQTVNNLSNKIIEYSNNSIVKNPISSQSDQYLNSEESNRNKKNGNLIYYSNNQIQNQNNCINNVNYGVKSSNTYPNIGIKTNNSISNNNDLIVQSYNSGNSNNIIIQVNQNSNTSLGHGLQSSISNNSLINNNNSNTTFTKSPSLGNLNSNSINTIDERYFKNSEIIDPIQNNPKVNNDLKIVNLNMNLYPFQSHSNINQPLVNSNNLTSLNSISFNNNNTINSSNYSNENTINKEILKKELIGIGIQNFNKNKFIENSQCNSQIILENNFISNSTIEENRIKTNSKLKINEKNDKSDRNEKSELKDKEIYSSGMSFNKNMLSQNLVNSNQNFNLQNTNSIGNLNNNVYNSISSNNIPNSINCIKLSTKMENQERIHNSNSHNIHQSRTESLEIENVNIQPIEVDDDISKLVIKKEELKFTNGIDFDRICGYNPFMNEIFARITCSICTLIPFEPLECKNCSAVVCKPCIERWKKKECVLKCGGENYDLPGRILRDIINSIVIKCRNSGQGCVTQLRIDYMKIHESECDYEEIKCPFSECVIIDIRKNIKIHLDNCEFNKIKCKFCKNLYKKSEYNEHLEIYCEEALIECSKCLKSEKRKIFSQHNCINALKEENKDLQNTISNLMVNLESVKINNDELSKQLDDERRMFQEKKTLMILMINLLKSNYELDDLKTKSHNSSNPIQIPYIFRFMTSSRTLQITNLADYTFTKISLNINFDIPTSHQSIVTSSKRIFIVGGVNHEKKTYEFDVLNKNFIEHAEMNVGRRRHILTELKPGVFIATGGSNQNEEVLKDCEAFIVSKNTWIKLASLNVARFYHTAFSHKNSYMYVVGGCHTTNSSLVNLNTIERIYLSQELNGSWEILSVRELSLLKPRSRLSYLFINSDKILLFGGIPDFQAVFYDINKQEISLADNQFNIEGRFFFNDRCTWQNETLFISSQSSRCIFNHNLNCWVLKEFSEEYN